jgi:type I restriction enzyme M protein
VPRYRILKRQFDVLNDVLEDRTLEELCSNPEITQKSFMVPKQEIVDNGYDLSINKYKKVEYVAVEYPPTSEIINKIMELDAEATEAIKELKAML